MRPPKPRPCPTGAARRTAPTLTPASAALAASLVPLVGACPDRPVSSVGIGGGAQEEQIVPLTVNRKLDILFVIDNSVSMGDEQGRLTAEFDSFMAKLNGIKGGLPSVHIGVVSSDVGAGGNTWPNQCVGEGDDGALQNRGGSCASLSGFYIADEVDADGSRRRNYTGSLEDTFSCIAALGDDGCGFEQHLEAMQRALDGSRPENQGFVRPDAWLAVVIIADEDDCSASDGATLFAPTGDDVLGPVSFRCTEWGITCAGQPMARSPASYAGCVPRDSPYLHDPRRYADRLKELKRGRDLVMVAGIIGDRSPVATGFDEKSRFVLLPSCGTGPGGNGGAVPAIRLQAFLDEFGETNRTAASICGDSLAEALDQIAGKFVDKLETRCLSGAVDLTDLFPQNPGIQPACSVTRMVGRNTDHQEERPIARCRMTETGGTLGVAADSPKPCWYLAPDPTCATESGLRIDFIDDGSTAPDAELVVRCPVG